MGIQGLLQALKPYSEPVHVKKYSGQRVGIDAYSWLHKGAYACGMELQLKGSKSKRRKVPLYVSYCIHRINMLKYNNVTPVVVFDGGPLPLKASTEQERRRRRETNLEKAQVKHAEGDILGAEELFQRAVEVTPAMAHEVIEVLREERVEFVVAPYEADAQLAYLSRLSREKGGIAAVISEDSDLLAYGCKAVLFKMDRYGHCEEICLPKLLESDPPPLKALSFKGFTQDLFLGMCVMAGCDFLASIPGIGVKRAHGLLAKYRNISRVLSKLKLERSTAFPDNYIADFSQAKAIFNHARVYDRVKRELVLLTPLSEELRELFEGNIDFLGPYPLHATGRDLPPSRAKAIADGRLDPITMEAFDSIPSFKSSALTNTEIGNKTDFTPSPITPLSMYGSRKDPPKYSKMGSFFTPNSSKTIPSPTSPFAMLTSKKESMTSFDSPPMQALHTYGRRKILRITDAQVADRPLECVTSPFSESSRPQEEVDSPNASQVTVSCELKISETHVSISGHTINDAPEMNQTFLAQLHSIGGKSKEAAEENSSTGFLQGLRRGIAPNNPFKRKIVETSSESLSSSMDDCRPSSAEAQRDDEEIDPSSCLSAKESNNQTRLRETSVDVSDCPMIYPELVSMNFASFVNEAELASQADLVEVQFAVGEDASPTSVLTEISPNFEVTKVSPSDTVASARPLSSVAARQLTGNVSVKSSYVKMNRSKSSVQNKKSRGRRPTTQIESPSRGGILKFFKPVAQ